MNSIVLKSAKYIRRIYAQTSGRAEASSGRAFAAGDHEPQIGYAETFILGKANRGFAGKKGAGDQAVRFPGAPMTMAIGVNPEIGQAAR